MRSSFGVVCFHEVVGILFLLRVFEVLPRHGFYDGLVELDCLVGRIDSPNLEKDNGVGLSCRSDLAHRGSGGQHQSRHHDTQLPGRIHQL